MREFDRKNILRNFTDEFTAMYGTIGKAKSITFMVTHQCNLRCTYCYEHCKTDEHMTLETGKKIVDFLFDQDAKNSELINPIDAEGIILEFIGGEPLLEVGLIDQIVEYFLMKCIQLNHRWGVKHILSICTNGILGDNSKVQEIIRKYDGRLSIGVTIDGDKEAHDACRIDLNGNGSYDRAIKLYRQVNKDDKYTKYTISPGNIKIFSKSIKHLIEQEGIHDIFCNCVFEEGWTKEHATELYYQLKDLSDYLIDNDLNKYVSILDWEAGFHLDDNHTNNWCGGDGRMLAFEPDGSILPCMRYSKISLGDHQPAYRIGDLDNGIGVLEDDKKRLNLLRSITRQSQSEQKCLDCPINGGCAWCSAYNYEMTGTPNKRVTYICDMHKARVLAQSYYHNKKHMKMKEHYPMRLNVPKDWALEIIPDYEYNKLHHLEKQAFKDIEEN